MANLKDLSLPSRPPEGRCSLTDREMEFLDFSLFSIMPHLDLFMALLPMPGSKERQRQRMSSLFNNPDAVRYLNARKGQIIVAFTGEGVEEGEEPVEEELGFDNNDKANMLKIIKNELRRGSADSMNKDVLSKIIAFVMNDMNSENKIEAPRIYLPESCTECRYKKFVDAECEDDCSKCNYQRFGKDNGMNWDHKTMFDKNKFVK